MNVDEGVNLDEFVDIGSDNRSKVINIGFLSFNIMYYLNVLILNFGFVKNLIVMCCVEKY